jgi:hypothetical protein
VESGFDVACGPGLVFRGEVGIGMPVNPEDGLGDGVDFGEDDGLGAGLLGSLVTVVVPEVAAETDQTPHDAMTR